MGQILGLLAIMAIVATAMAVIVGALEPAEAFQRVGAALALLLIIPALIVCAIQSVVTPLLSALVTDVAKLACIFPVVAALALLAWLTLRFLQRRNGNSRTNSDKE